MNAGRIKNLVVELQELIGEERNRQESERFDTLVELYNTFAKDKPELTTLAYLNKDLLAIVIGSYFDDIYKYKLYSLSERADRHKQGAYIIKWITKIRPIQIIPNVKATKELLFINSMFAIFVGFSFLELNVYDAIEPNFYKHLLYETHYRNISGKSYASLLYTIEQMAEMKK